MSARIRSAIAIIATATLAFIAPAASATDDVPVVVVTEAPDAPVADDPAVPVEDAPAADDLPADDEQDVEPTMEDLVDEDALPVLGEEWSPQPVVVTPDAPEVTPWCDEETGTREVNVFYGVVEFHDFDEVYTNEYAELTAHLLDENNSEFAPGVQTRWYVDLEAALPNCGVDDDDESVNDDEESEEAVPVEEDPQEDETEEFEEFDISMVKVPSMRLLAH